MFFYGKEIKIVSWEQDFFVAYRIISVVESKVC
jgi:hypothetical protein